MFGFRSSLSVPLNEETMIRTTTLHETLEVVIIIQIFSSRGVCFAPNCEYSLCIKYIQFWVEYSAYNAFYFIWSEAVGFTWK